MSNPLQPDRHTGAFPPTRWSLVLETGDGDPRRRAIALEEFAQIYWKPLYYFVRRKGYSSEDAEDLTQGFFLQLITKSNIDRADQARGKLRTFLLTALQRYIKDARVRACAQKRGGKERPLSLDFPEAERQLQTTLADNRSPTAHFEREWALSLMDQALMQVRDAYLAKGKERLFQALKGTILRGAEAIALSEVAPQLEMSAGALKVAVFRLRERYRNQLFQCVLDTVESQHEAVAELQEMAAILAAPA